MADSHAVWFSGLMVKSRIAVVSSPKGTAATPGPTWVTIQSSKSDGDVGVLPSSSPGVGAAETPKGDVGGENSFFSSDPSQLALLEGTWGTLRWARPVQEPCWVSPYHLHPEVQRDHLWPPRFIRAVHISYTLLIHTHAISTLRQGGLGHLFYRVQHTH